MTDGHETAYEPHHDSSSTDHLLQELQPYGYRPFEDEPDPRPLPAGRVIAGSIADIFDALISVRPYKSPMKPLDAIEIIKKEARTDFDKSLLETFSRMLGIEDQDRNTSLTAAC